MTATIRPALEHPIGAEGLLAIRFASGEVRLRAVAGPAVRIHDRGDHDLADMFEIDSAEGSLSLRVDRGRGWFSGRHHTPDLDVDVPHRATVVVESASGDIAADGLAGDQRYRTASGDVTLRACAGRLAVDAVSGDVDIVASGELELSARTVSGDLAVRAGSLPSLRASTTSGDLKVAGRFSGEGPFAIDTVSGDALVAPVGDVRIEMTTITGDLRSELEGRLEGGRGRRSLSIGSRGPLMTFRSLSGALRVVRSVVMDRDGAIGGAEIASGTPETPLDTSDAPAVLVDARESTPAAGGSQEPAVASESAVPPVAPERAIPPLTSEPAVAAAATALPAAPTTEPAAPVAPARPLVTPRAIEPDPAPTERAAAIDWPRTTDPIAVALAGSAEPEPATDRVRADSDDPRMDILRSLERGEIGVAEAGTRLEALDAGPSRAPGGSSDG